MDGDRTGRRVELLHESSLEHDTDPIDRRRRRPADVEHQHVALPGQPRGAGHGGLDGRRRPPHDRPDRYGDEGSGEDEEIETADGGGEQGDGEPTAEGPSEGGGRLPPASSDRAVMSGRRGG